MPPYNRSSCDQEDLGNFPHKALLLDEDIQDDHQDARPTPSILSDLCVFTGLPRQVTFELDQDCLLLISGLGDYSDDEIQDCWYTETDFLTFKQEALVTLDIYKKSPARVNNIDYTMRGLEHHLEEVRNRRKLMRLVGRMIVFDNQDWPDGTCQSKSDHVAQLYCVASMDAVRVALCRAATDQSEAQAYQRETSSELFNDEWISCISSTDKTLSYPQNHQQTWSAGFSAQEDVSGFDDSWLCAPSGNCSIVGVNIGV